MLKVNSKKTISLLAKNSFKENKLRNYFAVIAIILTTILFTGLFTVTASLVASIEESTMRQVGTSFHGGFKYLNKEQYDILKTHPSIKDISYSVILSVGENPELAKRPTEIRYSNDEINARGMFSMPTTGRLPQSGNELATDTLVLEALGISAKIGESVTLIYSVNGEEIIDTFTLCGFWQGDKLMQASQVWLNRSYVEKQLEGFNPNNDKTGIGTVNANVNFKNSFGTENKLQKVILDSGYSLDEISYGVNWAYIGNSISLRVSDIIPIVIAVLIIVLCGYLMISNVFMISITKDIRYFGLVKTIGTTPTQIRSIIKRQALWLCLVGIPIGLVIGYFVGVFLVHVVMSIINSDVIKMSINPLIFVFSAIFAVVTVLFSVAKPSKLASKVSPIEALRTTEKTSSKRKSKKSGGISLISLAVGTVGRNKKKAILITISLSLGLILLNASYSVANSFDMDEYLSRMIGSDFAVGDVSNFNVNIYYTNQDTLSPAFFEKLLAQNDIEAINKIYFAEPFVPTDSRFSAIPAQLMENYGVTGNQLSVYEQSLRNPQMLVHIYGLDDGAFNRLNLKKGSIDKQKLLSGKYVIAAPYDSNAKILYYDIGDTVKLPNPDGEMQEYEVLAIAAIPYNISVQHSHPLTPEFYLPSQVFLQQIENKTPMLTTIDVEDGSIADMETFLTEYCNTVDFNMNYNSKATIAAEYEGTQQTFKILGITVSLLIALVGIMNFINTVVTSIISRKREFAMLQSIGMTNKQLTTMLILESYIYILLTMASTLTIGSAICYLGLKTFTANSVVMKMYFTAIPSIICLPILLIIALLVPIVCNKNISKDSIVERLREE